MPQNRRSYEKTRRIALSGLLFALAMALSFIEGTLTIPGLLPGMKLGLANIVVMYALFFMGPKQALVLDGLKALLVFLVSGFTAGSVSVRIRGAAESCALAESLRRTAERLMAPFAVPDDFCFRGVRG